MSKDFLDKSLDESEEKAKKETSENETQTPAPPPEKKISAREAPQAKQQKTIPPKQEPTTQPTQDLSLIYHQLEGLKKQNQLNTALSTLALILTAIILYKVIA